MKRKNALAAGGRVGGWLPGCADLPVIVKAARVRMHRQLFEFSPLGVTKAMGLAALCAHLGYQAEEALVFGDAENDLPMFADRKFKRPTLPGRVSGQR